MKWPPASREASEIENGGDHRAGTREGAHDNRGKVKTDSKVLGDTVWIVGSENAWKSLPDNQVGYLPEEIYKIKQAGWTEDHLRKIHQAKKFLGGPF